MRISDLCSDVCSSDLPRYLNVVLDVAVFQTRLQDLCIVHGVCHMGTTTAYVFSLTLYLTARSKRVHVRKHKRLCAMAVFALNLSPERLLNCSVLVRRKLSMRNLDEQRKLRLRYRMTWRALVCVSSH